MQTLTFNNFDYVIYDVNLIQKNKNGKDFRYFTAVKVLTKPAKWINRVEHHHWKHLFTEIETNKKFYIEVDYYDVPIDANYL